MKLQEMMISVDYNQKLSFISDGTTTYTIMVEGFGTDTGNFSMAVTCEEILSVDDNGLEGFSFYPNPAQNVLNISAQTNIRQVSIFNLLGQGVYEQTLNATTSQLDISRLSTGTYLMRVVTVDAVVGTYKLIKE